MNKASEYLEMAVLVMQIHFCTSEIWLDKVDNLYANFRWNQASEWIAHLNVLNLMMRTWNEQYI